MEDEEEEEEKKIYYPWKHVTCKLLKNSELSTPALTLTVVYSYRCFPPNGILQ